MYTLDLVTLLQLLGEFHKSGTLRTEIPAGLPGLNQRCLVVIELKNGEMTVCCVKNTKEHILLSGPKAFQAISVAGEFNWVFEDSAEQQTNSQQLLLAPPRPTASPYSVTSPNPASLPRAQKQTSFFHPLLIPQRLVYLNSASINLWPRKHRQVYVLIDGVRNVEKIASMLSLPPQVVEDVLRDFQARGMIALK